jgi:hypothetical protein
MIHKLRVFHCVPGRLPALLRRFETDTLRLFENMESSSSWTVAIGESSNDLFLILQWESLAEREQKFGAFLKDPEWLEARRKSEEDGPITQLARHDPRTRRAAGDPAAVGVAMCRDAARPLWMNGSGVNGSGGAGLLTWAIMKTRHAAALALVVIC